MSTVVSSSSVNQTVTLTKSDCGKIAEYLDRGGVLALDLNPAIIDVLKAIAGASETTSITVA